MAIIQSRRSFLTGLGASLVAAPAIVRASSLMPVRGIVMPDYPYFTGTAILARWREAERMHAAMMRRMHVDLSFSAGTEWTAIQIAQMQRAAESRLINVLQTAPFGLAPS